MFMDALNASATNKKEPKKRKRRTSGSKDGNSTSERSPPHSQGSSITSPTISESKSVPPRFYQDTLDVSVEDDKDKSSERESDPNDNSESQSPSQPEEKEPEKIEVSAPPHTLTVNGLKGVLCYHKRKGPKKSIKWKPDSELEEVQYFELDETERVNVTKTFTDAKHLERVHERESFQKARNLSTDDVMEERTAWRPLILIEAEGQIAVEYGKLSKEKDIQAMKQKGTLQPLYLYKSMIPDSPYEPPVETHTYNEPTVIPLEDVTGNQDNVSDFRNMPWPDPKGNAPPQAATMPMPQMFQPPIGQFPNAFPSQFPGVPPFQGPGMVPPADWPGGVPAMMAANMPPGPMPPGALPPGVLPPGMLPDNMMLTPDMFGAPNPMFPGIPPEGFNMMEGMNMPPNMFPQDFNMMNTQGPPGADGFNSSFRGAMRGRGGSGGSAGHWNRGKGSSSWEGSPRGRSSGGSSRGRKQVCIYFQRKGSCRQGDNCTFLHPGVNCPF